MPILGTRKRSRLEENIGAVDIVLPPDELRARNDAFAKIDSAGDRYPAEYAKRVGK